MIETNVHASVHAHQKASVGSDSGIAWLRANSNLAIHFDTPELARQWAATIEGVAAKMEELEGVPCLYCLNPDHTRGQHAAVQKALAEANETDDEEDEDHPKTATTKGSTP